MRHADGPRKVGLEAIDERAADEGRAADDVGHRRVERGLKAQVLRVQVGKGNGCHGAELVFGFGQRAQLARRVAGVDAGLGDVARDHGAGADDDVIADPHRQQRGVGADRDAMTHARDAPQVVPTARRSADGEQVVDEHHAVADEAVVADLDQFANESMRLHPRARADAHAFLDLDEGPDEDLIAEFALVHVGGLDDAHATAAGDVTHRGLFEFGRAHLKPCPRRLCSTRKGSVTSRPLAIDS